MSLDKTVVGRNIRRFREAGGMTQYQLAEKAELSDQHISNIENGTVRPSLEALVRVAQCLGVGLDALVFDTVSAGTLGPRLAAIEERAKNDPRAMDLIVKQAELVLEAFEL